MSFTTVFQKQRRSKNLYDYYVSLFPCIAHLGLSRPNSVLIVRFKSFGSAITIKMIQFAERRAVSFVASHSVCGIYRPFSYCIDQAGLGAFTAKSGREHYNPPPLTVMWMNFDSPNFPSLCSLSAIISFQTCSNKCILYVLLFHKCIKIKYKTVNMYGVVLWLVQSSSRWNTIHSHRNYHVQLLSVRVGEFCHPARSR